MEAGSRCPGNAVQEISLHGAGKFPARRSRGLRDEVSVVEGRVTIVEAGRHGPEGAFYGYLTNFIPCLVLQPS